MTKLLIEMDRKDALALDLLWCTCGHRPNNHFSHGSKSCAHCPCKAYAEVLRAGRSARIVQVPATFWESVSELAAMRANIPAERRVLSGVRAALAEDKIKGRELGKADRRADVPVVVSPSAVVLEVPGAGRAPGRRIADKTAARLRRGK